MGVRCADRVQLFASWIAVAGGQLRTKVSMYHRLRAWYLHEPKRVMLDELMQFPFDPLYSFFHVSFGHGR